jgi:hypothetical protein
VIKLRREQTEKGIDSEFKTYGRQETKSNAATINYSTTSEYHQARVLYPGACIKKPGNVWYLGVSSQNIQT